jgi:site-specific recombinase XerD
VVDDDGERVLSVSLLQLRRDAGRRREREMRGSYRSRLDALGEDVDNRDPRKVGREDVKRTLRRWEHPNTKRHARTVFVSFFDWTMEEGLRETNPARQTRRPKKWPVSVYRLTRGEVVALMQSCRTQRERRVIYIGLLAGLRNQELRGLRRVHFERVGMVWVSPDIAKGGRERFVPVLAELEPLVFEILLSVGAADFVVAAQRSVGGRHQVLMREVPSKPSSPQSILRLVDVVARRAGIGAHIYPHLLRHAYGDHIARYAGARVAQATLGHASIDTTVSTYTGAPSLDELAVSLAGFRYDAAYAPQTPLRSRSRRRPDWNRSKRLCRASRRPANTAIPSVHGVFRPPEPA